MKAVSSGVSIEDLEKKYPYGETIDRKALQEALLAEVAALFEGLPAVQGVELMGSTPSYNDGDACTHSQECSVNGACLPWGDVVDIAASLEESSYRLLISSEGSVYRIYKEDMQDEDADLSNYLSLDEYLEKWILKTRRERGDVIDRTELLLSDSIEPEQVNREELEKEYNTQINRALRILSRMEDKFFRAFNTNFNIYIQRTETGISAVHQFAEPEY